MQDEEHHSRLIAADIDLSELELTINELAADHAALRIVLQCCLLRLFAAHPHAAPAALAELDDHVRSSVLGIPLARDDQLGGARWRRLVLGSAERILDEIRDTLAASAGNPALRKDRAAGRGYPSSSG